MAMVRGLAAAVGGAAVLVAGLVGCSSEKKTESYGASSEKPSAPSSVVSATSGTMTASAGAGTAKVTIDGQPKDVTGSIACTTAMGNLDIAIGDAATGIAVVMSPDASKVTSVGLGNVNGVVMGFQDGASGDTSATATKDGNTYKVTGKATGVDMANPMQPMTKPFDIEVTCP
jgi:lipoprotein LpqH